MPILTNRRASGILLLALLWAAVPAAGTMSAPSTGTSKLTREYDLKAAFLFNFTQFVEWPAGAFPSADTPITICILGNDPLGSSLDEMLENEMVRNRRIVVHRYQSVDQIGLCHILFVSQSETGQTDAILAAVAGRSVLTVGETEGFESHAGIIRFVVIGNKVRLRINVVSAKSARLTISSKLLRLAEIVTPEQAP